MSELLTFNWQQSTVSITDSIAEVKAKDFVKIMYFVAESIDLCREESACFSMEEAQKRLEHGERLFLLRKHGALGHVFVSGDKLKDLFISSKTSGALAGRFIQEVGNRIKKEKLHIEVGELSLTESRRFEVLGFV